MDPQDFCHQQTCLLTGRTYHYIDQRPQNSAEAPILLCLHGFPDFWYGWRHQIRPWVAAGYRVVAPDMLGYGHTDMPLEPSAYTMKLLCDDLAALLDHLGASKAVGCPIYFSDECLNSIQVVIGHDWGSFIAARFAMWYPERLFALALLSLPYTPPSVHHMSTHELARRHASFGYQVYFDSEQSTVEIQAHLPLFLRLLFRVPSPKNPPLSRIGELQKLVLGGEGPDQCFLNDKELEYYVSNFQRGMTGPLNYYRTTRLRFEEEKDAALPSKLRADLPVLFLYGTVDPTCSTVALESSKKFINQLSIVPLSGVGHWVMLEAPQTVTDEILQWLTSALDPVPPSRL